MVLTAVVVSVFTTVSTVRAASPRPPLVGVQLHSLWSNVTFPALRADLDMAHVAGANVVRVDVGWGSVLETGPSAVNASYVHKIDAFMAGAAARHLKVIATLMSTPCWASSAPARLRQGCRGQWWNRGVQWYPPTHAATYAHFVRWFTARYGADLAAVEIWNEPNQTAFWQAPQPAAAYAKLLRAAYPAAKLGDRSVPVLAGSMAGADVAFLHRLYQDGMRADYDGVSVHPYCGASAPNAPVPRGSSSTWSFAAGLASIRAAQLASHDHAPLWITEFGWASGVVGSEVSPARQAAYTARAIRLAGRLAYVRAASVYALHDDGSDASNWKDNLGLLSAGGQPKPAFFAFAATLGRRPRNVSAQVAAVPSTLRSSGG